jgi:hypothetical protein
MSSRHCTSGPSLWMPEQPEVRLTAIDPTSEWMHNVIVVLPPSRVLPALNRVSGWRLDHLAGEMALTPLPAEEPQTTSRSEVNSCRPDGR